MNNLLAAIDAFSNPDSVWYYVVGVIFLVLIFAALAVYIVLSNKKKKALGDEAEKTEEVGDEKSDESPADTIDAGEERVEAKADDNERAEQKAEDLPVAEPKGEIKAEDTAPVENAEAEEQPKATEAETPTAEEEPTTKAKTENTEPEIKTAEKKKAPEKSEPAEKKTEPVAKTETKKSAPKKSAAKPFIDRLLATKSAHGVYNEIKNTALSYPGMKAKLTKDDEQFVYMDKKMAAIELDGEIITLYLALDKAAVPSGFDVMQADGDFGIKTNVAETDIDSARKLIVFAMNVSMLTRNDKRRYVDYIQKAKDAKQRAKKK